MNNSWQGGMILWLWQEMFLDSITASQPGAPAGDVWGFAGGRAKMIYEMQNVHKLKDNDDADISSHWKLY